MADTNITETNVDYEPSVDIQDVNDEIWFDIINRTITPKEGQDLKDVLVQNDANSRNFGFMIQRYFEDDDLSTKNIRVHYVNSLNQHDISAVHSINIVGTNSDVLSFMWLVGNKVCIETGNVQFAIEFYDDDGYELYTKPTMVKIEQGIYTVGEIPEPDDWYKLFKQELLDIQNNIDAKNITNLNSLTKINLWELQSGVYTVSPSIDLCYAEATETDSERCYHIRTESVLYVSEYTLSPQFTPINYKSFSILTKDLVSGESTIGTPKHIVFITGTFREESHTASLSKYYFKETYNLRNWLQLGDGLRSVSPDLIGYTLSENEIADNSIKIALDDDYVKNLIQTYTDSEMSDTSENPVQNKVAKAYTDEKTKAIPTDISLTDNLLQLTANGEIIGDGVTLPKQESRVLFDTVLTQNTRTVFIDKDLSGAYLNLSEYSVFFFGKIMPNTPFYLNSFYTLAEKQYLTCYSGSHTTDGTKNILFHLHVKKSGILLKGVFPDSLVETADTDLITGGSFSTKNEKSTCAFASSFADGGIKNITFGVRTSGVDMLEGSRIIITGVDL